jgi:hypothetical protein
MRQPSRSIRRNRRGVLVAALAASALAGCVDRYGNIVKGGNANFLPHSVSGADYLCEEELPFDSIFPPDWPLADGLSAEQQRNRYYRKCMARLGHPEEAVAPPAPPP